MFGVHRISLRRHQKQKLVSDIPENKNEKEKLLSQTKLLVSSIVSGRIFTK